MACMILFEFIIFFHSCLYYRYKYIHFTLQALVDTLYGTYGPYNARFKVDFVIKIGGYLQFRLPADDLDSRSMCYSWQQN